MRSFEIAVNYGVVMSIIAKIIAHGAAILQSLGLAKSCSGNEYYELEMKNPNRKF